MSWAATFREFAVRVTVDLTYSNLAPAMRQIAKPRMLPNGCRTGWTVRAVVSKRAQRH